MIDRLQSSGLFPDPCRLVFDTNVVLSALLFSNGKLTWLRSLWRDPRYVPCISRATVLELLRVLAYPKFRLTVEEQKLLLSDYLPYCEVVVVPEGLSVPECRDPQDRMFLELALAVEAAALVSGDSDLLLLADVFPIPILSAEHQQPIGSDGDFEQSRVSM